MDVLNHKVSVVIPTKNAGPEFSHLLERLKSQKGIREIELVVVDSGSTDATLERTRQHGGKLIEIAPEAFTHSYARNLGAEAASGEFLLFTVQDALPTGDRWLYKLLGFLLDNADKKMAAVSCVEFPRTDSDLFYNFLIHIHYTFLQCLDQDRILEWSGEGYESLRRNGQLSNAACLIGKDIFDRYKFRGDYAEDLDLGIRLTRDGYRLARLSSVKVIHSHRRPPFYFLKRGFVDAVYMAESFPELEYPRLTDPGQLFLLLDVLFGIIDHISQELSTIEHDISVSELFELVLAPVRLRTASPVCQRLKDRELGLFLDFLNAHKGRFSQDDIIIETLNAHLTSLRQYMEYVYPSLDGHLLAEFDELLWKLAASIAGSLMGYLFLTCRQKNIHADILAAVKSKLVDGV